MVFCFIIVRPPARFTRTDTRFPYPTLCRSVGDLCRTHPINGFRPGLLADLHQLVADPADGFIPGDPLPLAVDQLERIFESAITVHELAHAGALDAMRAQNGRAHV